MKRITRSKRTIIWRKHTCKKKDVSHAKEQLQLTVKFGGSMAVEADEMLRQLGR